MKVQQNETESLPMVGNTHEDVTGAGARNDEADAKLGNGAGGGGHNAEEGLGYTQTVMYGRYSKILREYAKDEADKIKLLKRHRKHEDKENKRVLLGKPPTYLQRFSSWLVYKSSQCLGEDWVFLTLLGIIMALFAFVIEEFVVLCTNARMWAFTALDSQPVFQYLAWVIMAVSLILFAAGFVFILAPQSVGSGIPEMRTILRGVPLKDFLTFKTLVAKVVGLTAVLGSGMPLGKEGPFVHMASIVAQLLSKLAKPFKGIYENESRNAEMLAAACAVGLGSCFSAPIGGVLFSIEETTTYFAVRNYWRGFFACVIGSTGVRLLAVWFQGADTVQALYPTNITTESPFDPYEMFVFILTGVLCGLAGAAFVWVHHHYVLFIRSNKHINKFLQKNRFLYPGIIALIISSLTFPLGTGQFLGGELSSNDQLIQLFSNFTWSQPNADMTVEQADIVSHWTSNYSNVYGNLICYTLFHFFFSIIASTMPVPSGMFIPTLKMGGGFGRLVGELMARMFPYGVRYGGVITPIMPGGYAMVGAAAFSGSVTHSISVAVVVFEITGQISYVVPVLVAVLLANAVGSFLQPSMYDSVTLIKKLPYLPDLLPGHSGIYKKLVGDFMVRDVKYIWRGITYQKLKEILKSNKKLRSLPLVDNPDNMILLGSVHRYELINMIDQHIGHERRMEVAQQWMQEAEQRAQEEELQLQNSERRPSRFEVLPAPDILGLQQLASDEMLPAQQRTAAISSALEPNKPILKSMSSVNIRKMAPTAPNTPMVTSPSNDSKFNMRSAFDGIFRRSTNQHDAETGSILPTEGSNQVQIQSADSMRSISKKVQLPRERIIDMSPECQKQWELEEMAKPTNMERARIHIDPSPFQLVECTSLIKVHSLFSMLGINHAYVTQIGRLVGVVGLKELRKAIEDVNSNSYATPNRERQSIAIPAEEKPLLASSDEALNINVTSSMCTPLRHANVSIDMEHDKAHQSQTDKAQESEASKTKSNAGKKD